MDMFPQTGGEVILCEYKKGGQIVCIIWQNLYFLGKVYTIR